MSEQQSLEWTPNVLPNPLPPEETSKPKEEVKEEKTKLQQFIEELSKYPDYKSAKQAIPIIAQKLGVTRALGYKALRKVEKFQTPIEQAREPTVAIPQAQEIPIVEPQPTPPPTPQPPPPQAPPSQPTISMPTAGFKENDIAWMFEKAFDAIAMATDFEPFKLSKEEAERLGEMWTPIINAYLPTLAPQAGLITASITTLIIIAPRIKAYRDYRKKQKEKIVETQPTPQPEQQTQPEQSTQQESTNIIVQVPKELPKNAGFLKALEKMA